MGFKFSLLSLERDNCNSKINSNAKTSQQKKFSEAVDFCHKKTKNRKDFGKCMSRELKK